MQARQLVETLGANEVVSSLEGWVAKEREVTAIVVAHLAVMEREGVHLDLGYASLFRYCVERMGYSRDAAFKRIRAARAALVRPEVLDDLESGALTLSGLLDHRGAVCSPALLWEVGRVTWADAHGFAKAA